jgi:hypothetical protein
MRSQSDSATEGTETKNEMQLDTHGLNGFLNILPSILFSVPSVAKCLVFSRA